MSRLERSRAATVGLRRRRQALSLTASESWALEARRLLAGGLGWTTGVALPSPAGEVSATMAVDGSILLFGGGGTSVERLAPGATSWAAAGSIDSARSSPGVARLASGTLLVYGGRSIGDGAASDSAIDFSTGVAKAMTSLNTPREQLAYATDGAYAYAMGGISDGGAILSSVERYDPSQADWFALPSLPSPVAGAEAAFDGALDLFVMGGTTAAGVSNAVYELRPGASAWVAAASLPVAESSGAAVLGADGSVEVIGGIGAGGGSIAAVQRLDPATGTWAVDTPLPSPVSSEAAVVDSIGRIEVIGGLVVRGNVATKSAASYLTDATPAFASTAPTRPTIQAATSFQYTATASGTPTPTFSLVNPPSGAQINPGTGLLSWAPTLAQTGTFAIDIRAGNVYGQADQAFLVTVKAPAPTGLAVTGASTTSLSLAWRPGAGPVAYYRVYMDGQLPQYDIVADKLGSPSATIAGLASQAAGHTFYVTSFDTSGNESQFSAPVVGKTWYAGQLQYSPSYLSVPATHLLTIALSNPSANPAPTTYAIVGGAPVGMTIDPSTGVVSWTPTDAQALQGYFPTFSSTNAVGTSTVRVGIAVQLNYPSITASYPGPTGRTAYANLPFAAQFVDGSGAPVTWKLNSAPAGATLSSTGLLRWTPTIAQALAAGSASISVTATNYAGSSTFLIAPALLTAAAPANLAYTMHAAAGTLGVTWGVPPVDGSPVASYVVTLTYSYSTGGSGKGGGGSHTFTTSTTATVSGSTLAATFSGIPFGSLPSGRTRFTILVAAVDAAGNRSAPASASFIR